MNLKSLSKAKVYKKPLIFIGGFLFDLISLGQIDDRFNLIVIASYNFLLQLRFFPVFERISFYQKYKDEIFHFILGAQLSLFSIFFFKSSSLPNSFILIGFLFSALMLNETRFLKVKPLFLKYFLSSLCFLCFFQILFPVIFGVTNTWVFLGVLVAFLVIDQFFHYLQRKRGVKDYRLVGPVLGSIFIILYFFRAIPPIPLVLVKGGMYRNVLKIDGEYQLEYHQKWWQIFRDSENPFYYKEGDKVFFYGQVYSPANFQENLKLYWERKEQTGWVIKDTIPISIQGGRKEGYRFFVYKKNITLGLWRVKVLTNNDLEIGRRQFLIKPREFQDLNIRQIQF